MRTDHQYPSVPSKEQGVRSVSVGSVRVTLCEQSPSWCLSLHCASSSLSSRFPMNGKIFALLELSASHRGWSALSQLESLSGMGRKHPIPGWCCELTPGVRVFGAAPETGIFFENVCWPFLSRHGRQSSPVWRRNEGEHPHRISHSPRFCALGAPRYVDEPTSIAGREGRG